MSRSRIVLETSDDRKSAMLESADLQGESLTDWFEEQFLVAMPRRSDTAPAVREVTNPSDLQDPDLRHCVPRRPRLVVHRRRHRLPHPRPAPVSGQVHPADTSAPHRRPVGAWRRDLRPLRRQCNDGDRSRPARTPCRFVRRQPVVGADRPRQDRIHDLGGSRRPGSTHGDRAWTP